MVLESYDNCIFGKGVFMYSQMNLMEWMQYLQTEKKPEQVKEVSVEQDLSLKQNGKIEDFGNKIGGARKDVWKSRGLSIIDTMEMNKDERNRYIKKENIWLKPNYEEMVQNGLPVRVAWFIKQMRDATPVKPIVASWQKTEEEIKESQEQYINFVTEVKEAVMNVKTEREVQSFFNAFFINGGYIKGGSGYGGLTWTEKSHDYISKSFLLAAQVPNFRKYDQDIKKKQFCFSEDEKLLEGFKIQQYDPATHTFSKNYNDRPMMVIKVPSGTVYRYPKGEMAEKENWKENSFYVEYKHNLIAFNLESREKATELARNIGEKRMELEKEKSSKKKRKGRFTPPQLEHIKRDGKDVRDGKNMTGQDYLDTFKFYGGEFGNWLNEQDRQASLNMGYEAFMDLAEALEIEPSDISLGNRLSIAFGARGHGSALAHYESDREVINLTKMKGAGSLAHEWGHALDNIICKQLNVDGYMTENQKGEVPFIKDVVDAMNYRMATKEEIQKEVSLKQEKYIQYLKGAIEYIMPDRKLNEEQIVQKNNLIEQIITGAKEKDTKPIEALSSLNKEITGRLIQKAERDNIVNIQMQLHYALKVPAEKKVCTDFYNNSKVFDEEFSKSDKGYWQSNVEMFARAFACYVHDKIDGRSDYLCGHSEMAVVERTNDKGEIELIKAFPVGEERERINHEFDKLIDKMKDRGLLHHRASERSFDMAKETLRQPVHGEQAKITINQKTFTR